MDTRSLLTGLIVPQWPAVLEPLTNERPSAALHALRQLGQDLHRNPVDTVLVLSPFWVPRTAFYVESSSHHRAKSDFSGFAVDLTYRCPGDAELARLLIEEGRQAGLPVDSRVHWADLASSVPLKVLFPNGDKPIVPLSSSELPLEKCLEWGRAIRRGVERTGKRVLLLSGGGLSHNLTACLHWEDSIAAVIFDQKVLNCLTAGRGPEVKHLDPYWIQVGNPAAGFRDLFILLGALGPDTRFTLHAYDGAPGVGWAVMTPD